MEIKAIKTERDYHDALKRLEDIFDAATGTAQGDELEVLGILIDQYEHEYFPIEMPDPIGAIKFRMDQLGYNQRDLATIVGLKSRASAIMNRKQKLSLGMIRQLNGRLRIPSNVLIQAY